jgi:hypothetical protein
MTRWTRVTDPGGRVIGYKSEVGAVDKNPHGDGLWFLSPAGDHGRTAHLTLTAAKARAEALARMRKETTP